MQEKNKNIPDYDLLAKYFASEASNAERKSIEDWINSEPENKKSFDRMYYLLIQSSKKELEKQVDVGKSWKKMQSRMSSQKNELSISPKKKLTDNIFLKRALQIAAIIIFGLVIKSIIPLLQSDIEYIIRVSEEKALELNLVDSSIINLNMNSKLTYPEQFTNNERKVKLSGEAFFKVKSNPEKPFIIETKLANIKVLGTSFNVEAYDTAEIVKVTVISGKVELSGKKENSEKIILIKGESAQIYKSTNKIQKEEKVNINKYFLQTKTLVFKDTELYIVAEILSEAYNIQITIENKEIKFCPLTATFKDAELNEILEIISNTFKIKVKKIDNNYVFTGEGC